MIEALELRGASPKTVKLYVDCTARFARHFNQSPEQLGREDVRRYLLYLIHERKVAWSTYKQALAALRFLYRWVLNRGDVVEDIRAPRPERRLPVVLSFAEVHRFFAAIPSFKHRTLLMFAYAAGLRVSEASRVRVADIDGERMVIRVVQGKRKKDRYTILSPLLLQMLRHYWWAARPTDYLFPSRGKLGHVTNSTVQRACLEAQVAAGLAKEVTPHTLRHVLSYCYTSKRTRYLKGNSCCAGSSGRSWRPCRTASNSACTAGRSRSTRAMIQGVTGTTCVAGKIFLVIKRRITV